MSRRNSQAMVHAQDGLTVGFARRRLLGPVEHARSNINKRVGVV